MLISVQDPVWLSRFILVICEELSSLILAPLPIFSSSLGISSTLLPCLDVLVWYYAALGPVLHLRLVNSEPQAVDVEMQKKRKKKARTLGTKTLIG